MEKNFLRTKKWALECHDLRALLQTDMILMFGQQPTDISIANCGKEYAISFLDLEPGAFKGLKEDWPGKPPVYPVGPLIRTGSGDVSDGSDHQCLKWLDEQSRGSVLFVSFGSGGTLSHEQLTELALGLELSGVSFLWVVKSPNEDAPDAAYFTVQSMKDPFDFLPKGFMDRTKGLGLWFLRGLLSPSPAHESTGGFLTHCGWNSGWRA
ncbi:hypothetical protein C3L33_16104, partial [Rhododendron williamsianum]